MKNVSIWIYSGKVKICVTTPSRKLPESPERSDHRSGHPAATRAKLGLRCDVEFLTQNQSLWVIFASVISDEDPSAGYLGTGPGSPNNKISGAQYFYECTQTMNFSRGPDGIISARDSWSDSSKRGYYANNIESNIGNV
jgi:hypothetical protein